MGNPLVLYASHELSATTLAEIRAIVPGARILGKADLAADPGLLPSVEVCYSSVPEGGWPNMGRLRWVQTGGAGVDRLVAAPGAVEHPAIVTNARIHAEPISNHLWGMLLMLTRNLHGAVITQREHAAWRRDELSRPQGLSTLAGRTLCVAGLGEIGRRCARLGAAFDMRVIGIRRNPAPVPFVEEVYGPERRIEAFARSNVVMAVLPGTPQTNGFIGAREMAVMKGTFLLNAGRGKAVDTTALLAALREGRVKGAGLDVTDPEPLPDGHPLWTAPNVLISPHYAGAHAEYDGNADRVFLDNLRRFVAGEPLRFLVDKRAGY